MGQAGGLEQGNPVIKNAQDPWSGGMIPLGMEELFWKQSNSLWGHAVSPACILCTPAPL